MDYITGGHYRPSVNLGSSGPTRVKELEEETEIEHRPVGFTATLKTTEPILWEGDNA